MMDTGATRCSKALDRVNRVQGALVVAWFLGLAGCSVPQPVTTAPVVRPPKPETKGAQQLAAPVQPPAPAPKAAPPAPLVPKRVVQSKLAPAPQVKGAQRLATHDHSLVVRAREKSPPPHDPPAAKARATVTSALATDAPVQALVVKGEPPKTRPPRRNAAKALLWFGLVLGAAASILLARLALIGRFKPAGSPKADNDELKMPREMGLKEPIGSPD